MREIAVGAAIQVASNGPRNQALEIRALDAASKVDEMRLEAERRDGIQTVTWEEIGRTREGKSRIGFTSKIYLLRRSHHRMRTDCFAGKKSSTANTGIIHWRTVEDFGGLAGVIKENTCLLLTY